MESSESTPKKPVDTESPEESREVDSASILDEQRRISLAREGLYSFLARSFKFEVDNEFLTMVAAVQPVLETFGISTGRNRVQEGKRVTVNR